MSPVTKQQKLEDLQAKILSNQVCEELAAQATQLVFGDGSPDAELVFIGEAPGKNEDLQGKPFVGAAGKFLNVMLEMIGLSRSDIYITNIVKYRPPNNRDPLPEEKKAFLPYLKKQLDIISPKLIVTLGRHSMDSLLPGCRISEVHGQPKRIRIGKSQSVNDLSEAVTTESQIQNSEFSSWVILPLFHPAAALYNGGLRQTLIDDFLRIPAILKSLAT